MEDNESTQTGMNRRQLLKRSAIVGGALVWATPVVQSLGGTALAATASGTTSGCGDISYVIVVIRCDNPTPTELNPSPYLWYAYKMEGTTYYSPTLVTSQGGQGATAFAAMLAYAQTNYNTGNPFTLQSTPPASSDFSASVGQSGDLVFTIDTNADGCLMASWMVHDGTVDGTGTQNDNSFADGQSSAILGSGWTVPGYPTPPSDGTGTFTWSKPGYTVDGCVMPS